MVLVLLLMLVILALPPKNLASGHNQARGACMHVCMHASRTSAQLFTFLFCFFQAKVPYWLRTRAARFVRMQRYHLGERLREQRRAQRDLGVAPHISHVRMHPGPGGGGGGVLVYCVPLSRIVATHPSLNMGVTTPTCKFVTFFHKIFLQVSVGLIRLLVEVILSRVRCERCLRCLRCVAGVLRDRAL